MKFRNKEGTTLIVREVCIGAQRLVRASIAVWGSSRTVIYLFIQKTESDLGDNTETTTKIMMNVADPERAFSLSFIPNSGVGLGRYAYSLCYCQCIIVNVMPCFVAPCCGVVVIVLFRSVVSRIV